MRNHAELHALSGPRRPHRDNKTAVDLGYGYTRPADEPIDVPDGVDLYPVPGHTRQETTS